MLTQAELKEILNYDPETGDFTWKVKRTNKINIGDKAGFIPQDKRIKIGINNRVYRADRLVYLYKEGIIPHRTIIHINGDMSDNRLSNLKLKQQKPAKKKKPYKTKYYGDDERVILYDKCNYWEVPAHPPAIELLETMIKETEKEKANLEKLAERVRNSPSYIAKKKRITERRIERREENVDTK